MAQTAPEIIDINTKALLQGLIDCINNLPLQDDRKEPLYMDLEGVSLSASGPISIVTIYIKSMHKVFLVDVFLLKEDAFNSGLRQVLESADVPKVFFDVRTDSTSLYHQYNISLDGITDAQLYKFWRSGLQKCKEGILTSLYKTVNNKTYNHTGWAHSEILQWVNIKNSGKDLYISKPTIWNERPLDPLLRKYCAGDVVVLPAIMTDLSAFLAHFTEDSGWDLWFARYTELRLRLSRDLAADAESVEAEFGPMSAWDKGTIPLMETDLRAARAAKMQQMGFDGANDEYDDDIDRLAVDIEEH